MDLLAKSVQEACWFKEDVERTSGLPPGFSNGVAKGLLSTLVPTGSLVSVNTKVRM